VVLLVKHSAGLFTGMAAKLVALLQKRKQDLAKKQCHDDDESKLESLLALPAANRLLELDKAMQTLVQRKDLLIEEKVRLFEEVLALYRQTWDTLQKHDAVIIMDPQPAVATQTDNPPPPPPPPPPPASPPPSAEKEEELKQLLATYGFDVNGRLQFRPGSVAAQVAIRGSQLPTYAATTYQNVLRYLVATPRQRRRQTSSSPTSGPTRAWSQLVDIIFQTLASTPETTAEDLRNLYGQFPKLESYARERAFHDWHRMK
jgi:hypothetical protein